MANNLMHALDFTTADLDANRAGKLSPRQRDTLPRRSMRIYYGCLPYPLVGGVTLFLGGLLMLSNGNTDEGSVWTVIGAGILAIVAVVLAWQYRPIWRDLQTGVVQEITGRVQFKTGRGNDIARLTVHPLDPALPVGHFTVNHATMFALSEMETYHVYYAPHTRTVLAIEVESPFL